MLAANSILYLHDNFTKWWHAHPGPAPRPWHDSQGRIHWHSRIELHHRANFDLWHFEDDARAPGASDADIAAVSNYVTARFGAKGSRITAEDVRKLREQQ